MPKDNYIPLVSVKAKNNDKGMFGITKGLSETKDNPNLIPGTNIPYNEIKINDNRKFSLASGKSIRPNMDLKTGTYNLGIIENIVDYSLLHNIDPYYAIATGLQETNLGQSDSNIGHIIGNWRDKIPENASSEEAMVMALKIKRDEALKNNLKNEADIIQNYNGRHVKGLTSNTENDYYKGKNKMFYGVPLPINTKENPVYGRQIIDVRDNVIKKNPQLVSHVNNLIKSYPTRMQGLEYNAYVPSAGNAIKKLPINY